MPEFRFKKVYHPFYFLRKYDIRVHIFLLILTRRFKKRKKKVMKENLVESRSVKTLREIKKYIFLFSNMPGLFKIYSIPIFRR